LLHRHLFLLLLLLRFLTFIQSDILKPPLLTLPFRLARLTLLWRRRLLAPPAVLVLIT
jgi:hypothetical protein